MARHKKAKNIKVVFNIVQMSKTGDISGAWNADSIVSGSFSYSGAIGIMPAFKRQNIFTTKQTCAVHLGLHAYNGLLVTPCASPATILLKNTHLSHNPPTNAYEEVRKVRTD